MIFLLELPLLCFLLTRNITRILVTPILYLVLCFLLRNQFNLILKERHHSLFKPRYPLYSISISVVLGIVWGRSWVSSRKLLGLLNTINFSASIFMIIVTVLGIVFATISIDYCIEIFLRLFLEYNTKCLKKPTSKNNINYKIFWICIIIGVASRILVMLRGHNFDFESYCIVGDIAGHFRNVYAETKRYNYAPIFLCIQGTLFRISQLFGHEYGTIIYRILIVLTLTMADFGIALFITKRHSWEKGLMFFLNPVSIIITGYHNQFDNIAILFALLSVLFYNEKDEFDKRDILFVLFGTLSLMTKHILFLMPVYILFRKGLSIKKKIVYSCVPPALFLLSFVPFTINNAEALNGILSNVFFYRSFNNFPLLQWLFKRASFLEEYKFEIFIVLMLALACPTRKYRYENQLLIYLIAMVSFSSAIANQYLVIPLAAICVFDFSEFRFLYMLYVGAYLLLESNGLHFINIVKNYFPYMFSQISNGIVSSGYFVAAWILCITLFCIVVSNELRIKNRIGGEL